MQRRSSSLVQTRTHEEIASEPLAARAQQVMPVDRLLAELREVGVNIYTLQHTWAPDPSRPDDHVFRCDRKDVGRTYRTLTPDGERWLWTIYIVAGIRLIEGVPVSGLVGTLDEAKAAFRTSYEKLTGVSA